jgi:hypothetical protein
MDRTPWEPPFGPEYDPEAMQRSYDYDVMNGGRADLEEHDDDHFAWEDRADLAEYDDDPNPYLGTYSEE